MAASWEDHGGHLLVYIYIKLILDGLLFLLDNLLMQGCFIVSLSFESYCPLERRVSLCALILHICCVLEHKLRAIHRVIFCTFTYGNQ